MVGGESVTFMIDDKTFNSMTCLALHAHPKPVEGTVGQNHTLLVRFVVCFELLFLISFLLQ